MVYSWVSRSSNSNILCGLQPGRQKMGILQIPPIFWTQKCRRKTMFFSNMATVAGICSEISFAKIIERSMADAKTAHVENYRRVNQKQLVVTIANVRISLNYLNWSKKNIKNWASIGQNADAIGPILWWAQPEKTRTFGGYWEKDEAKRDQTLVMFFPIAPRYLQGPKRGCVSSTAQRFQNYDWLVVLTILKNSSQLGRIIPYIMEK